jgi:hypothetical protein
MKNAFVFLKLIEDRYGIGCHSLRYSAGRPSLTVFLSDEHTQDFYFDETDFAKTPQEVFEEIQRIITSLYPST